MEVAGRNKNDLFQRSQDRSRPLKLSIPVKATVSTADGVMEYEGQLVALGEGYARIYFDHPLAQGTELTVVVEFRDRRDREIRFRYDAKVTSPSSPPWYEVAINYEEGVGISGKDAKEILADLFPEENQESIE